MTGEEVGAAHVAEYQSQIAALEREVGQLTMEIDLLKKIPRLRPAANSDASLIVSGPKAALLDGDAK